MKYHKPKQHSEQMLSDKTNTDRHIFITSSCIKMSSLLKKAKDDKIEKAILQLLWHNSFRRDMSIRINRHFWAAGKGGGGLKGRER